MENIMENMMNQKRGAITYKLLDILNKGMYITDELFGIFFGDPFASPYRRLLGIKRKRRPSPFPSKTKDELELQRFYSMLWNLKKQGLIEKRNDRWRITKKGKERKRSIIEGWKNPLPKHDYEKESTNELKIVIFDVPEKERRKRVWLRYALLRLGFRRLQKSVWIGKVKIPEEFLEDLRKIHIVEYVEIFAITKTGSLRQIE